MSKRAGNETRVGGGGKDLIRRARMRAPKNLRLLMQEIEANIIL